MTTNNQTEIEYDVAVVGAGFAGLNALYRLREQGLRVKVFEAGSGVGGTWYWNRYPGARVDLESLEYSYAFLDSIQQEWKWPQRFSSQEDVLRYLEWVTDRLDLRKDIQFDTWIQSANYDEESGFWTLQADGNEPIRAKYCIMALGFLTAPYWPDIPGRDSFKGKLIHTGNWPREGVDLRGQKVGIIGAGATTVQLLPAIADEVGTVTVFQRTPNWCFPMNNMPMPEDYESYVKSIYDKVRKEEYGNRGPGSVLVDFQLRIPEERGVMDLSPEEREAVFEKRWSDCAIHMALEFNDIVTNRESNRALQDFLERKIRETVKDQDTADLLIPKNHGPFIRRPCGEHGYYEAFNRENVKLVDALQDPIAEITSEGIRLQSGQEFDLDVIICATGFDAGTGGLTRIDLRGRDSKSLKEYWESGARTHLGMMTHGFPNLFYLNAVQSPSAFFSPPLCGNYQITTVLKLIESVQEKDAKAIEPTEEAEDFWVRHTNEVVEATLLPEGNSWWMGANIPGKPRQVVVYTGPFPDYCKHTEDALANLSAYRLLESTETA